MKSLRSILLAAAFVTAGLGPAQAIADEADKAACASLEEGDDCTRGDGDAGVCIPDESDPDVLTCDDDTTGSGSGAGGSGGDDGSAGCSTSGSESSSGLGFFVAAIAGLALSRRRLLAR